MGRRRRSDTWQRSQAVTTMVAEESPLIGLSAPATAQRSIASAWLTRGVVVFAAAVAMAVVGFDLMRIVRNYSPVPYYDMWNGYLGFMRRLSAGEMSAWWSQHNEHRIVWSRMLFWIDFRLFGGLLIFLLVVNGLLVVASVMTFTVLLRRVDHRFREGSLGFVAPLLITSWLFLGMQYNNLDWAFQSQFFLAQLIPLLALFVLSEVSRAARPGLAFVLACALGVAAYGTMANGVLTLPLMIVFAVFTGLGWRRAAILLLLSIVMLVLYFGDIHLDDRHGALLAELANQPSAVSLFTLLFLGSPSAYLLQWWAGAGVTLLSGLLFVGLFACAAISWYRKQSRSSVALALLLFCLYVIASGVLIAGARLEFGVEYATSSRYTTPVVMAWLAIAILNATSLVRWFERHRLLCMILMIILDAAMLRLQWHAKEWSTNDIANQDLAGLALTLEVNDLDALHGTFPDADEIERDARWARSAQRSLFRAEPFRTVANGVMGQVVPLVNHDRCRGQTGVVHRLHGDNRFVRVDGLWPLAYRRGERTMIRFLDPNRVIIGIAITDPTTLSPMGTPYAGYLSVTDFPTTITAHAWDSECEPEIELPTPLPAVFRPGLPG